MQTRRVFKNGKPLDFDPNRTLGKGGEGEVFDLGVEALKLLKGPDHPDYAGNGLQQERDRAGARLRLELMQKKLKAYPKVPSQVVAPVDPVTDSSGKVIGFTMPVVRGAQVLRQLTKPNAKRSAGIDNNAIAKLFIELHQTVSALHQQSKVQIGDFNHLGVLVKQMTPYLIDADSFQILPGFACRSFTPRFVDPLVCFPDKLVLKDNHSESTDWYAFTLMLFECLLNVAAYGGTTKKVMRPDDRVLNRISVFNPEINYPDNAVPLLALNDELMEFFRRVLERDWRGPFPLSLLKRMRWTICTTCSIAHSRSKCPLCATAVPGAILSVPAEERHGKMRVLRQFQTAGVILDAVFVDDKLLVLYHEAGVFHREGKQVMPGELQPGLTARICGDSTLFASDTTLAIVTPGQPPLALPVDSYRGQMPVVATNGRSHFYMTGGRILRDDVHGSKYLGSALPGQTMLWAGPKFGFGTYRVGNIRKAFVFDVGSHSLNDSVDLPPFVGDPLEAECHFSSNRAWFFSVNEEQGEIVHRCAVIDASGRVIASATAKEGDDNWLSKAQGRCAATLPAKSGGQLHSLFVNTNEGLLRIDEENGALVQKVSFPDTKGVVRGNDRLALSNQGILLIGAQEVRLLSIS
jgi:H/ACA ribonucleoprotein complex subunit 3